MPYATNSDLPEGVRKALPAAAQTIFRKAYNGSSGDEGTRARIAWSAVKHGFKKVGGKWVAKETVMKEALSASDKRQIIQSALDTRYPQDSIAYPHTPSPWIVDVFDESVVFELGGSLSEVSYTMEGEGKVILGDDTKRVYAKTEYTALESLRIKYAELVREVGIRGVSAEIIKDVSETCIALIGQEEPNALEAVEALEDVETALETVKAIEAVLVDSGETYPPAAFAHVPDPGIPTGWRVRLWDSPTKGPTVKQLGYASAMFTTGGLRGKRADLSTVEASEAKATIRAAYRKLGVETADIPAAVREDEVRERVFESCEVDLQEVTKEGIANGRLPLRIISPGFNSSNSRHYSESAIADAASIFQDQKMYADHATEAEEEAKPERSLWEWVAILEETRVSDSGNAVGIANIHHGPFKELVRNLYEAGTLAQLGTSINCLGTGSKQTIEGRQTIAIEGLQRGTFGSVDFVTEAGAGGQAGLRESAQDSILDAELVDLATLREARPDLVQAIETEVAQRLREEVKEAMSTAKDNEDLQEQVATLTKERDGLQTTIDEGVAEKAKAEAQGEIKTAVEASDLPTATKARLISRFTDATDADGVAEAIKGEADYIAELKTSGIVKGLGPSKPEDTSEAGTKAYREALQRQNPDWDDAALDKAMTGR